MKTKKKPILSAYQKATVLMNRETNRAVAHVEMLKKLYAEAQKKAKASS
jgi:hypothetical protein